MSEKTQKFILLTIGVLAMSLAIGYFIFAWVEPTDAPPAGNVPAPINVGSSEQVKSGRLGIGVSDADDNYGLTVGIGTGGIKITNTTGNPTFLAEDESGDTTPFVIDADGNVGIGGNIAIFDENGNEMTFWKDTDSGQEGILRLQSTAGASVTDGYTVFSVDAPSANPIEAAVGLVVGDEIVDLVNMKYGGEETEWGLRYIRGTTASIWKDFRISGQDLYGGPITDYFVITLPDGNVGIGTPSPGARLDVQGGNIRTDQQLVSTVADGTAPLVVNSDTMVSNLNADKLDGYHAADLLAQAGAGGSYIAWARTTCASGWTVAYAGWAMIPWRDDGAGGIAMGDMYCAGLFSGEKFAVDGKVYGRPVWRWSPPDGAYEQMRCAVCVK